MLPLVLLLLCRFTTDDTPVPFDFSKFDAKGKEWDSRAKKELQTIFKNASYHIKTVHFLEWPLGDIHTLAREICYKLRVSNYLYQFVGTLYCIYRCCVEISVRAFFVMRLYIYGF